MFRSAVAHNPAGFDFDGTALGRNHDFIATPNNGPTDEFLVDVGTVHIGGVKKIDSVVDRGINHRHGGVIVTTAGRIEPGHAHAAQPERGNLTAGKRSHLHATHPRGMTAVMVILVIVRI